jgi:hypothetical protein
VPRAPNLLLPGDPRLPGLTIVSREFGMEGVGYSGEEDRDNNTG